MEHLLELALLLVEDQGMLDGKGRIAGDAGKGVQIGPGEWPTALFGSGKKQTAKTVDGHKGDYEGDAASCEEILLVNGKRMENFVVCCEIEGCSVCSEPLYHSVVFVEPKLVELFGFGTDPPTAGKPPGDGFVEKDVNGGYIQQFGKSCAEIVEKLMKSDDRREGPEELVTPCAIPGEESLCKDGT
jgi:hypothetical protein